MTLAFHNYPGLHIRSEHGFSVRNSVWLLLFVCLLTTDLSAQYLPVPAAELKKQITAAKADSTRSRLYGILGWSLRFTDSKESQRMADEMIRLSQPANDYLRLAEAYRIKGFARVLEQKLSETLELYATGERYAVKANNSAMLAHFKSLTAGMYQDKGDYDKAIHYYLEGLKIAETSKDPEMIATLANNLAEAYSDAGRSVELTLPYYQIALKEEIAMANWQYVGMIYSNMAKDYMLAGKSAEAEQAAAKAIDNIHKKDDRDYVYATVMTDIGEVYAGIGKYNEAEKYLQEGFRILDSIGTKDNKLIPLAALARLYSRQQQPGKAQQAAKQLLQLAGTYKSKLFLRDGYKVLSDVARQKGQPTLALQYFEQYKNWDDSVFNENRERSIANAESRMKLVQKELEVKYEAEKKTKENEELRLSNLGLQNRTVAAIIIAFLLLVLGVVLVLANRGKTKKNRQLEMQKKIIEQQSGEKDILIREINHRVKNNLQVISSLLNLQAYSLTDPEAIDALRDSHKRVKAISLIHQKLYGFEAIAAIPLEEYISSLFADLKTMYAASDVGLVCATRPRELYLDIESAVPVGLILNEVITNALKYAFPNGQPGILSIQVSDETERGYTVIVHDNGVGLPAGFDAAQSGSLGFRIIKELTRQLRGQYEYTSGPGTTFTLQFPNSNLRNKRNS
jgi:two-component sensor histidine kinase